MSLYLHGKSGRVAKPKKYFFQNQGSVNLVAHKKVKDVNIRLQRRGAPLQGGLIFSGGASYQGDTATNGGVGSDRSDPFNGSSSRQNLLGRLHRRVSDQAVRKTMVIRGLGMLPF